MEHEPRRLFRAPAPEAIRNISVQAHQLEPGDYSAAHDKYVERTYTKDAGQTVVVVFKQTPDDVGAGSEGTTVYLDQDDSLEITRGRISNSF